MQAAPGKIEFRCGCGKQFHVSSEHGGKSTKCPQCGAALRIPTATAEARPVVPKPEISLPERRRPLWGIFSVPSTFGEILIYLLGTWGIAGVMALVAWAINVYAGLFGFLLFAATTVVVARTIWELLGARRDVMAKKDVSLMWGFMRLVAWDPVEGVLFLKNKALGFYDDRLDDAGGGVKFIYPVFGDELALRVPLEVQTLHFEDNDVLTKEYLSVTIRGSIKWRINDIRKFYLLISRELRLTTNLNPGVSQQASATSVVVIEPKPLDGMVQSAIEWLRVLAKEQTRIIVSHMKSGLLIADKLSAELPEMKGEGAREQTLADVRTGPPTGWSGGVDGLQDAIYDTLVERTASYGIVIEDVSLQEIQLPLEIVKQCIEACKLAYLPLISQRKASARHEELKAEADVIGADAVATKEVLGAAPSFTLVDFLGNFLNNRVAGEGGVGLSDEAAARIALEAAAKRKQPNK
jgi:regulator of protease activity HflC (stomatin/prohibitin superfamily)